MQKAELIDKIQTELHGLYWKRMALKKERCKVLSAVDSAQFVPTDTRREIHDHYNRELALIEKDIADMRENVRKLKGGGSNG